MTTSAPAFSTTGPHAVDRRLRYAASTFGMISSLETLEVVERLEDRHVRERRPEEGHRQPRSPCTAERPCSAANAPPARVHPVAVCRAGPPAAGGRGAPPTLRRSSHHPAYGGEGEAQAPRQGDALVPAGAALLRCLPVQERGPVAAWSRRPARRRRTRRASRPTNYTRTVGTHSPTTPRGLTGHAHLADSDEAHRDRGACDSSHTTTGSCARCTPSAVSMPCPSCTWWTRTAAWEYPSIG